MLKEHKIEIKKFDTFERIWEEFSILANEHITPQKKCEDYLRFLRMELSACNHFCSRMNRLRHHVQLVYTKN